MAASIGGAADPKTCRRPGTGEGAFAASGTCLVVEGDQNAWFATGGAGRARVFRSVDRGRTWTVHETPITADQASSGVILPRISRRSPRHRGRRRLQSTDPVRTRCGRDGRRRPHLEPPKGKPPAGYRSVVAFVPGASPPTAIAAGPSGSDISTDGGESWRPLSALGFHAVAIAGAMDAGWGVGDNGLIARFRGVSTPKP